MPTIKNTDYLKMAGESIKTTKEKKEHSPLTELFLRFNPEPKGPQADALKQKIITAYEGHQAKYKSRQWVRVLLSVVSFSIAYFWVFKPLAKKEALLAEEYQKFNLSAVAAPAPAPAPAPSPAAAAAAAVLPKDAPSQAPARENKYFLEADKQKYVLQDNSIESKATLFKQFEQEYGKICDLRFLKGASRQRDKYYQQYDDFYKLIDYLKTRSPDFVNEKKKFDAIQSEFLPNYIDKLQDEEQKNSWGKWIEFLAHLYEGPPS